MRLAPRSTTARAGRRPARSPASVYYRTFRSCSPNSVSNVCASGVPWCGVATVHDGAHRACGSARRPPPGRQLRVRRDGEPQRRGPRSKWPTRLTDPALLDERRDPLRDEPAARPRERRGRGWCGRPRRRPSRPPRGAPPRRRSATPCAKYANPCRSVAYQDRDEQDVVPWHRRILPGARRGPVGHESPPSRFQRRRGATATASAPARSRGAPVRAGAARIASTARRK